MKHIASKSDEGAWRNVTPKNTNFLCFDQIQYSHALIDFKWISIGHLPLQMESYNSEN